MDTSRTLRLNSAGVGSAHRLVVLALYLLSAQASAASVILYDQTANCQSGVLSFTSFSNPGFDSQAADDFSVPAGDSWLIATISTPGVYGTTFSGRARAVNVTFFSDAAGVPGAALAGCDYAGLTSFVDSAGTLVTTLSDACVLPGGASGMHYWLSVQAAIDVTGADAFGTWAWVQNTVQAGSLAQWRNPANGFHQNCTSWGAAQTCNFEGSGVPDMCFSMSGIHDEIFKGGFDAQ